jgi:outer membrane receptor protein involved in Fe transport
MKPAAVLTALWILTCLGVVPGVGAQDAVQAAGGESDSLAARIDSTGVPQDSLAAGSDSLVADSLVFVPLDITLRGNTISGLRGMYALDYGVGGREEILEFISSDPAEALVMNAGIRFITRGFYGGPQYLSVRGRDPRATAYMMDGIPVTDAQIEVFDPHWLPIEGTGRVESIKGPATALFGGGATGGLVNVVSHDVLVPVPLTRLNVWFGSYDTRLVGAGFMRSIGNNFGFVMAYDYFSTAGFVEGAGYRMEKLYGKVSARFPSSLKFDVIAYRHVGDTGVLGAEYTDRIDSRTFLDLSFELGTESVMDLDFYYFDVSETFRGSSDDTYDGSQTGASLVWTGAESARYVRRLGGAFRRKSTTAIDDINEVSAFGELSWSRGDFGSQAVLRVEKNSQHDVEYALSFPLTYGLNDRIQAFARLDRGFSYPIALDETRTGKSETTRGASGGILCDCKALQLSFNVFYYDIDGASVYRTDDTCTTRLVDGVAFDLMGAEVEAYMPPVYGFEASVSYSRGDSDGEIEGAGAMQPLNVLAWGIRYRKQFTQHIGTGVTFAGRWSSSTSLGNRWECADEACTETECVSDADLPAVRSAMLYTFLSFDDARAFFRIRNLFNESIPIAWDQPSLPARSYEFGLTWDLHD